MTAGPGGPGAVHLHHAGGVRRRARLARGARQPLVDRGRAPRQRRRAGTHAGRPARAGRAGPGWWASARPGSTTTASTAAPWPTWPGSASVTEPTSAAGRQTDLPLVIHTRSASEDTLAILREEGGFDADAGSGIPAAGARRVSLLHGNRGGRPRCARPGLLHLVLRHPDVPQRRSTSTPWPQFVPLDRMLIETDSPYLAPVPHRGKTNNPSYVPFVARADRRAQRPDGGSCRRSHQCQL